MPDQELGLTHLFPSLLLRGKYPKPMQQRSTEKHNSQALLDCLLRAIVGSEGLSFGKLSLQICQAEVVTPDLFRDNFPGGGG